MLENSPKELYNEYINGNISQKELTKQYIYIIENYKNNSKRYECLDYMSRIRLTENACFTFLETLITSENNDAMRERAILLLLENFPHRSYNLIRWFLNQGSFTEFKKFLLKELLKSSNKKLREFLSDFGYKYVDVNDKYFISKPNKLVLKELGITKLNQIKNLDSFDKLHILNLKSNKLEDLKGIEQFSSLVELNVSENKLHRTDNLNLLQNLQILYLNSNNLKNIKNLTALKNLQYLAINGNPIKTLEGLEKLRSLKILESNTFPILETLNVIIERLEKGEYKSLEVDRKQILSELQSVDWNLLLLELRYNRSFGILNKIYSFLSSIDYPIITQILRRLEFTLGKHYILKYNLCQKEGFYLELMNRYLMDRFSYHYMDLIRGSEQSDIDFYEKIVIKDKQIIHIHFRETYDLFDGSFLLYFPKLNALTFEGVFIDDFSVVEDITKLHLLGNWDYEIETLSQINSIFRLQNLEELCINNFHIGSIDGFDFFPKLKKLDLSSNNFHRRIKNIDHLRRLENLEELSLAENFISDLSGFENLSQLKLIDLSSQKEDHLDQTLQKEEIAKLQEKLPSVKIKYDL
ncbi:MAG: hypothetical protein GF317_17695 [Candidatus Lokiarchaeota archaeon]|nr:hypothetical protein [Candidatus Lokiarchaeota archaeon]MBD3201348.1 hypothetical protein [Candidatus Lokiarchaeota archaeon]